MENMIQASGFVIQPRLHFKNLRDQMIYQYLVSKASYKPTGSIKAGQTIIIISELEKELDWTRRKINTSLERLNESRLITFKVLPQKRGVLVTVLDYESFQKLENYTKNKQKNVQENVNEDVKGNVNENVNEDNGEKPCGSRGDDLSKNQNVNENVQENVNEDVQENANLISITAFITSVNSNINSNKTLKEYLASANVKNMNLSSTDDIEIFVDFAAQLNALPANASKKILVSYFDCIRLTRQTCTISANILAKHIEKLSKYSVDQIHYALWKHVEQHDDKRESYTLGILRNTDVHEAKRGLMKLKNKKGAYGHGSSIEYRTAVGENTSTISTETQRLEELAKQKGLSGTIRDTDVDF
ncbi:hypothetical protein [Metabacillus fastidiosus]|uniref:hypothetical protein n=1 Tax=Metabacillus fastidiosus TaxID=1458 RepID=UPI003D2A3AB0